MSHEMERFLFKNHYPTSYSTMGYKYEKKVHASFDTYSLSVIEWKIITISVYDKNMGLKCSIQIGDWGLLRIG